ncbi:MAG: UDP-glucose 4-epimerase GalE [Magnetococcales bacterium]|nr:UDP-glucose 4-epimerase GalE [Magnetococcales bacterium]
MILDASKTVLVTGGAGYIGSHACKALAAAGYLPVTLDNLSKGHAWAVRWGPLERVDLRDRRGVDEVLERHRPTACLHFAGLIEVGESVNDPALYYDVNTAGTLTLLTALRDHGVKRFIFSSTCAIYGVPERLPLTEDHPRRPINPYGASKAAVEAMLEDFSRAYDFRYAALRYFNAAGGDPAGEIGEAHQPETHLIPLVLDAALGRRPHVAIYGQDYPTPDGSCVRDYIHVDDLAEAHRLALAWLERGGESGAFNLGNGQGFSVRQVIETARRVTGREIEAVEAPRRPGDPPFLIGDARRAREILGWTPRRPELETILGDAWRWRQRLFSSHDCPGENGP